MKRLVIGILCLLSSAIFASDMPVRPERYCDLVEDLQTVQRLDACLEDCFPVHFNHFLITGYVNMPSARMPDSGLVAAGYSHVAPYRNYNLFVQAHDRLELSLNYRLFRGIPDPVLSPMGFGDFSDKGANWKVAIIQPEDSEYRMPGIAVGMEDFLGTRSFKSLYVVATQVIPSLNLEASLGWGKWRLNGWFGGAAWYPFRTVCWPYLEELCLAVEYDNVNYLDPQVEPHPGGRSQKSSINFGVKHSLWKGIDTSISYIRGEEWAWSVTAHHNFGKEPGIIAKGDDPLPYRSPVNTEPVGCRRPEEAAAHDLVQAFDQQGMRLLELWVDVDECGNKFFQMRLMNLRYRFESDVRERIQGVLGALLPSDIGSAVVVVENEALPLQQYHFQGKFLRKLSRKEMSSYELCVISPLCDYQSKISNCARSVFQQHRPFMEWSVAPRWKTCFGSSSGKFKYSVGPTLHLEGHLFGGVIYSAQLTWDAVNNLKDCMDVDRLNPSQIINVRSDAVGYYHNDEPYFEYAYLQKHWNLGCACFARVAGGYFEIMYGGLASEFLYYPLHSSFAIGFEAAVLPKRARTGLGFERELRQLTGFIPSYHPFLPYQFFANFYYDLSCLQMDFKVSVGQFLARDKGIRFEAARYFENGVRFSMWYTYTDGDDFLNGTRYHDKGVAFTLPLDYFYPQSSRSVWGYSMAAWLRDVGARSAVGRDLFPLIAAERH